MSRIVKENNLLLQLVILQLITGAINLRIINALFLFAHHLAPELRITGNMHQNYVFKCALCANS